MSGSIERKRNQKGFLKEKVLQVYDKLFQGQDITQGRADFWDDFFLLKTNVKWLTSHFEKYSVDDLPLLKHQLNRLFSQCLYTAHHDHHRIRIANAIQTMDALVLGVYRCKYSPESSEDPNCFLLDPEQVEDFMQRYTVLCSDMFREDRPERLRALMLNSMHTFATASSNFRCSPFALGLLCPHIFDVLRLILVNAQLRYIHGLAACKLLGILTQFGKSVSPGPSLEQLCITDDELLLNGISSTVSLALSEYNVLFRQQHDLSASFLSSMTSFFGQLFVGDLSSNARLRPCDSLLMCMCAIAKNSAHISTILSYSTAYCDTASPFDSLSIAGSLRGEKVRSFSSDSILGFMTGDVTNSLGRVVAVDDTRVSDCATTSSPDVSPSSSIDQAHKGTVAKSNGIPPHVIDSSNLIDSTAGRTPMLPVLMDNALGNASLTHEPPNPDVPNSTLEPRNLLADLLEYCSIVMQHVKSPEALNSCQLCLIIVLCITQNPVACSILHDHHVTFKVWIHKSRSRYRKPGPNSCADFSSRPIAVAILSLIVEFIRGHLMKNLPHRLYSIACSICRNLLIYQSNHKIRLDFDWKQLWSSLFTLLQFILNLDHTSVPLDVGLCLIHKVLEIFNICILLGDNFLQAADVYDDLYYELIRMRQLFEKVYEHGLLHTSGMNTDVKTIASEVVLQMSNIRSIVNHFDAKIVAFSTANCLTSLTENQVLAVVRDNYDSLTLRVLDELDTPDVYTEPADETFFNSVLETVLKQFRKDCVDVGLDLQSYFHELSVIH